MRAAIRLLACAGLVSVMNGPLAAAPLVIAHRGASAERPEHTMPAYERAIEQGADYIEPDLVPTKDGHLVARHENEIGGTTDVADRPEFAARKTTKTIDGERVTGWFTEDFTLAELKRLRARERLPDLRPANTRFDGAAEIPTLEEIIALVKTAEKSNGRRIGLYPETKHPAYFRSIGLPLEERLLTILDSSGYRDRHDPVFIQSFETSNLRAMRPATRLRLIQLMASTGGPADQPGVRYADMATPEGLRTIATYADGVGVEKALVIPRTSDGRLAEPTALVGNARAAGLAVHVWTFRPENAFLPQDFRRGAAPSERGDAEGEIRAYLAAGIDGLFTDSVPPARAATEAVRR